MVRQTAVMVERTCDNPECGRKFSFDDMHISAVEKAEFERWFAIAREVLHEGKVIPIVKHACCAECGKTLLSNWPVKIPQGAAN